MSSKLSVSITDPCNAKWADMSPSEKGRFCSSCSTEVVDFTGLKETGLQKKLAHYQHKQFCGRFENKQLANTKPMIKRGLVFSLLTLMSTGVSWAQENILPEKLRSILPQRDCETTAGPPVIVEDSSNIQIGPGFIQPDTMEITMGVAVAEIGLKPVEFGFDKSELTAEALGELQRWLDVIQSRKVDSIKITGHADSTGNYGYNVKLSQRRAEEVKQYLLKNGVKAPIVVVYHGFRSPRVSNDTKVGRARNRRVDIRLIEHHKVESN